MTIKHKQATVAYRTFGAKKTNAIVFLHGFLENQSMWDFLIPGLEKRNFVITIDLLGHGKSESIGYIHTMEAMAEQVKAVLDTEHVTSAFLTGHSMGGYVSLAFAELYPDICAGIVLLNATTYADNPERKKNRDRAIALVKQHQEAFLSMAITNLFAEENRTAFAKEIETLKQQAMSMSAQGVINALEGMKKRKDRTKVLKKFQKSKSIICGTSDPILPFEEAKHLAETCNCKFLSLEGGHMSTIENRVGLLKFMHFIE